MMVKPWAKAIAAIPGRPTPSPTIAAVPAPMNTNAKVPMNSARSLGAIRLDIVLSRDEIDAWRDQGCAKQQFVGGGAPDGTGSAAGRRSEPAYSAAIVRGLKSTPSAFATPAP